MNQDHENRCGELHPWLDCERWDSTFEGSFWNLNRTLSTAIGIVSDDLASQIQALLQNGSLSRALALASLGLPGDLPETEPPGPLGYEDFADVRAGLGTDR